MIIDSRKNQEGSVAVIVAILFTVLMGFFGLAYDVGNLITTKTMMQNAVDAAACAGAHSITGSTIPPSTTDQTAATTQVNSILNTNLNSNGFPSVTITPTFPTNATWGGNPAPSINVSLTQNISTPFMSFLGVPSISMSARAEAVKPAGGVGPPFNYALFAGSHSSTLTINGSQDINGSVHSNYRLLKNGSGDINGSVEGVNRVTINGSGHITGSASAESATDVHVNGSANIDGGLTGGAGDVAMPDFSQDIINAAQSANTYTGNKSFNGIQNVDGTIYVQGNVTLNGNIDFSGSILATGNVTINGSCQISGSNQFFIYSKNGNITVNGSGAAGNSSSGVIMYAPGGNITLNGSSTLYGRAIANTLTVNGSQDINGGNWEITSLPPGAGGGGNKHVKLIK